MSRNSINLEVITPDKTVVREQVNYVRVPAGLGSLGILPGHAPLMTSLDIGILEYTRDGEPGRYEIAITEGYLQLLNNDLSVLVKSAEKPEEIDLERALAAKERAERRLSDKSASIDVERAKTALKRALNRINIKNFMLP